MVLTNDEKHSFGMIVMTDDGPLLKDFVHQNGCLLYNFPLARKTDPKLEIKCLKMRESFTLISSDDIKFKDLISYESNFRISKSNRYLFHKKSKTGTIRVLSVTNGAKTRHFRIKKDRTSEFEKDVTDIRVKKRK